MHTLLLGISIILFGMVLILVSSGSSVSFGFWVSAIGLIVSFVGWKAEKSKYSDQSINQEEDSA